MPRQRHHYPRVESAFPDDFPQCLERFMEAAGLSASELARRLGVSTNTVKRWTAGVRPTSEHLIALQEFADSHQPRTHAAPGEGPASQAAGLLRSRGRPLVPRR